MRQYKKTSFCDPRGNPLRIKAANDDATAEADNRAAYEYYLSTLIEIAVSRYRWDGLPDGVNAQQMEYWAISDGYCALCYDESLKSDPYMRAPEGFAVMRCALASMPDNYNLPLDIHAYSVTGYNGMFGPDNSVLMLNSPLRFPMLSNVEFFARRLADIDRTLDLQLAAQKTPKILQGKDEQQLTLSNIARKMRMNVPFIRLNGSFDIENIRVLDMEADFQGVSIQTVKHQIWNECMGYLGINNINEDKRERMISSEVRNNMGDVIIRRNVGLQMRRKFSEQANAMFGLNIDVDYVGSAPDMPDDQTKAV